MRASKGRRRSTRIGDGQRTPRALPPPASVWAWSSRRPRRSTNSAWATPVCTFRPAWPSRRWFPISPLRSPVTGLSTRLAGPWVVTEIRCIVPGSEVAPSLTLGWPSTDCQGARTVITPLQGRCHAVYQVALSTVPSAVRRAAFVRPPARLGQPPFTPDGIDLHGAAVIFRAVPSRV
jgi:hypothetical protein